MNISDPRMWEKKRLMELLDRYRVLGALPKTHGVPVMVGAVRKLFLLAFTIEFPKFWIFLQRTGSYG